MPDRDGTRSFPLADLVALSTVCLISLLLVVFKVRAAISAGPEWDTYAFLSNAAEWAGRGYGYAEPHRPPLISLITAAAFRLGAPMHEAVIQWVDGAFSLSGVIAFYLIARKRFAAPLSAVVAIGLFMVQPVWEWMGTGYTDFPSVALSMWFLLAIMTATEKSKRYFAVAAVIFVAAVMMRYTSLLIIFPGLVWFALRASLFGHARAVVASAALGIATYLPMGSYYARRFGDGLFPFIWAFGISELVTAPDGDGAIKAAGSYYLSNLPTFLSEESVRVLGWVIVTGAVVGLGLGLGAFLARTRPAPRRLAVAALGLGLAVIGQFGGGLFARQLGIPAGIFIVWKAIAPREEGTGRVTPTAALDAVVLLWFLAYFDFHGNQNLQLPRYVTTMAGPVLYFTALGWWQAVADIGRTITPKISGVREGSQWLSQTGAAVGLGVVIAFSTAATVAATPTSANPYVVGSRKTAAWLKEVGGDLSEQDVYSDLWPMTAWYGRLPVKAMPFFEEQAAFSHELTKSGCEYFVTIKPARYDDFREAYSFKEVTVLQRSTAPQDTLPRVAYLGKAWDNYLEDTTDYRFFLMSDSGRYGWEGTAFYDEMSAEELAEYDTVAVFGVRWRDRAAGEKAITEYVENGGTVVMDASGNIGQLAYELGDTVLFDTVIKRGMVEPNATVTLDPEFARDHPQIGTMAATPFIDEGGTSWYGAEYTPLPGTSPLRTLASVGGKPVVTVRDIGKGRVYWIGYNLVWHSFLTKNSSEGRLVAAVFEDAIDHARSSRATP